MNSQTLPRAAAPPDTAARLTAWRGLIETRLDDVTRFTGAAPLQEAMRYSVLSPGKRLRPLLTLAVCDQFGRPVEPALDVAAAIEMVHAASLVVDDLPCMDDDAERRGMPTTHARFGQDVAILAAIALLSQSFDLVARSSGLTDAARVQLVQLIAGTVGPLGLTRGQHADLHMSASAGKPSCDAQIDLQDMTEMHHRKTGVLFIAAAEAGAVLAGADAAQRETVRSYACSLGLAFQVMDDLSDDRQDGDNKDGVSKDEANLARRFGVAAAQARLAGHIADAHRHIAELGQARSGLGAFTDLFFAAQ